MQNRLLRAAISAISLLLVACGGGGSETSQTATPLIIFSDGSGIGRTESTIFYSPEVSQVIKGANEGSGSTNNITLPDSNSFPVVATQQFSTLRRGVVTVDNTTINVGALKDNRFDEVGAAYFELPDYTDLVLTGGQVVTSTPTSGIYRYTGTQTSNARSVVAPGQMGTFTLDINFSSRTFSFSGQTATFSVTASGNTDAQSDLFASTNVVIVANGQQYSGHFYGLLHSNGARGVTGIIVTSDYAPDYSASFIGIR